LLPVAGVGRLDRLSPPGLVRERSLFCRLVGVAVRDRSLFCRGVLTIPLPSRLRLPRGEVTGVVPGVDKTLICVCLTNIPWFSSHLK